jgi:hypothetical protein
LSNPLLLERGVERESEVRVFAQEGNALRQAKGPEPYGLGFDRLIGTSVGDLDLHAIHVSILHGGRVVAKGIA